MADIKRLLNKGGWTGRELGIIELTNMAITFKQQIAGETPTPIIETAQLQKMINNITDRTQGEIFNGYISIHEWLSLHYNIALANEQQAQLRFKELSGYIAQAAVAEDVYQYIESLPVIMTEKQYKDAVEQGRQRWFKGEDGTEERADSVISLIYRAFEYYAKKLEQEPTKPNPLKPIRKKYLSELVKSPLIRSRFNEATGNGYYILEDGRRSDEMSEEEWQDTITTPKMREFLREANEAQQLQPGFMGISAENIAAQRILDRSQILWNGGSNEDAARAQEQKEYEAGLSMPAKWVLYDDPPEDLTKWDFLLDGATVYETYCCSLGGMAGEPDAYIEEAKDFVAEFSELVELLIKDIDSRFFKGEKGLAGTPIEQWETTVFDWQQLYDKDFYGFRADTDSEGIIFDGNKRALFNGIAIIKAPGMFGNARAIDERGYYIPPKIRNTLGSTSLESFFTEAEEYAENADNVENGREALLDSYYFIKGYNTAIDMIAKYYDVPELTTFKLKIANLEAKIDALNELVPVLYMQIRDTQYEDEELKQKKLQVLKDFFPPIDYKSLEIPEEKIEYVQRLFADFQAFKDDNISSRLFYRPQTEEEGGSADE